MEFETRAIHAGQEPDALTGSVNVPIYQTSTYAQDGVLQMRGGHDYARTINPTRTALEQCLASLEGGAHGICFSSGMGATTAIMELFAPGSRTVAINDVYGGTYRLFSKLYEPKGYAYEFADLTDEGVRGRPSSSPADLVWLETPSNPLLKIVDIAAIAERAHAAGCRRRRRQHVREPVPAAAARARRRHRRALDDEVHRRPLGRRRRCRGHERRRDSPSACISCRTRWARCRARSTASSRCAAPRRSPCAWSATATTPSGIARWLTESPAVSHVYYPGLAVASGPRDGEAPDAPLRRHDRLPACTAAGAAVDAALAETGVWTLGESLGGVESLIEHPGAMTHASLAGSGFEVPDDLIRLSVGIEHVDDLLHDLVAMLARATQSRSRADSVTAGVCR